MQVCPPVVAVDFNAGYKTEVGVIPYKLKCFPGSANAVVVGNGKGIHAVFPTQADYMGDGYFTVIAIGGMDMQVSFHTYENYSRSLSIRLNS
jgi:hypothetical protein